MDKPILFIDVDVYYLVCMMGIFNYVLSVITFLEWCTEHFNCYC